ncbi:MAG: hypothetical protein QOC99_3589 [Acidobacteriota bacterium]|jgi:hypothetical protein|nr:hypothetical protein [Acidobacteriota bacterium]
MSKRKAKPAPLAEPKNPLTEVFGFPISNKSARALHYQENRLCPFNNIVPSCTKVSEVDPLGVCSLFDRDGNPTVVCPTRFKEDFLITAKAARFFFRPHTKWVAMPEIRLKDSRGKAAGNVDIMLVAHDDGFVTDFGALEIQAVYISGNVRRPFRAYTEDLTQTTLNWAGAKEYPRPDYLSSSRKRFVSSLIYKGSIFRKWEKKMAVVIDRNFFDSLPKFREVHAEDADLAWLIYELRHDEAQNTFFLDRHHTFYTRFDSIYKSVLSRRLFDQKDLIKQLEVKTLHYYCESRIGDHHYER